MKNYDQVRKYDWADDYQAFTERFKPYKDKKNLTKAELIEFCGILAEEVTFLNNKLFVLTKALVEVEQSKQNKSKIIT